MQQDFLNRCLNPNLVLDDVSELKMIQQEIEKRKAYHDSVLTDIADLERAKRELGKTAMEYSVRIERLQQTIEDNKSEKINQDLKFQKQMDEAVTENDTFLKEHGSIKQKLTKLEEERSELEKQIKVSSSMPQKQWVFTGNVLEDDQLRVEFDIKPYIRYPIRGGSAVITFDDEAVASRILEMEEHEVELEECRIKIKAQPLKLQMLEEIEIQTQVCKKRVLVSDIPKLIPADQLLDKLELHFSKLKNSGGEVQNIELLEDSGNVVVTFCAEGISENLTKKALHQMEFRGINKLIPLRVSAFINGEIENLKVSEVTSKRSVLFTGIPDIMDEETLRDYLEIHFQKPSNEGGEVDAFGYIPEGKSAIACFEADNEMASEM
ncbi:interferon-induced protein 35 isoform X2 [Heterodontus francisci]|uniref:interferon-induced protein 35 isoform X2 n=1 Tax=Heterodontus francisci TaxID=7792 RepID=UPI00355B953D